MINVGHTVDCRLPGPASWPSPTYTADVGWLQLNTFLLPFRLPNEWESLTWDWEKKQQQPLVQFPSEMRHLNEYLSAHTSCVSSCLPRGWRAPRLASATAARSCLEPLGTVRNCSELLGAPRTGVSLPLSRSPSLWFVAHSAIQRPITALNANECKSYFYCHCCPIDNDHRCWYVV